MLRKPSISTRYLHWIFAPSASLDMPFPADHGAYVYYVFEGAAREDYRAGRLGQIEVQ